MNEREIREYDKIPKQEIRDDKWSEPFKVGDVIPVLGKEMRIVKVKKLKGEIILRCLKSSEKIRLNMAKAVNELSDEVEKAKQQIK